MSSAIDSSDAESTQNSSIVDSEFSSIFSATCIDTRSVDGHRIIGKNHRIYLYEESRRKEFLEWWNQTEWARTNAVLPEKSPKRWTIYWGGEKKSAGWEYFHEVARISNGKPGACCKRCDEVVGHSSTGNGSSTMTIYTRTKKCMSKSTARGLPSIQAVFKKVI